MAGKPTFITPAQFEQALQSLEGYFGVVGVFGGNPATHPQFHTLCLLLQKYFPKEQRGLWCNDPMGKGKIMRETFDPRVCNLNVHMDPSAYYEFKRDWPESQPFGRDTDSRHSPCYVAMKDMDKLPQFDAGRMVGYMHNTEANRHKLISNCDINQHWSAMLGVFRGQLRAWFCEIAGAQAMLHQHEPDYPDTGIPLKPPFEFFSGHLPMNAPTVVKWWELPMQAFAYQVRKHCHECGVPMRGYGELAIEDEDSGTEQVTKTHQGVYQPKRRGRRVELVTVPSQLGKPLKKMTEYLQNARGRS